MLTGVSAAVALAMLPACPHTSPLLPHLPSQQAPGCTTCAGAEMCSLTWMHRSCCFLLKSSCQHPWSSPHGLQMTWFTCGGDEGRERPIYSRTSLRTRPNSYGPRNAESRASVGHF